MVEGAGHFVQSDAPDQLAAAISAWYDDAGVNRSGVRKGRPCAGRKAE